MIFYEISILNSPLLLTYLSNQDLENGAFVKVEVRNSIKDGIIIQKVNKPKFKCLEINEITEFYLPEVYIEISKFIRDYYFSSIGDALNLFTLFKKNQLTLNLNIETNIELSTLQNEALEFINNNQTTLLFGDTGSGKTEIYIKKIESVINDGKSAIMLLPEISLTPQMEKRLKLQFGDLIAIWHSKVTKKKKNEILEKIYSGEIRILAGARSALFLPLLNIGLIIVDEEHDDSYKSNQRPRYSARDLTLLFGKKLNAKVILGSATPSVSSYHKFPHFRLKGRYFESKKEIFFESNKTELTPYLLNEIDRSLNSKHQIIIFLPTRANFKYLFCDSCGEILKCPYCAVGMSLHKDINALKCHYCNYTTNLKQKCFNCGNELLSANRIGTSEVVELLQEHFNNVVISKFDRDEIKSETKLKQVLNSFNDGKIDILVGTQMLSKGHDYHNVNLAIILGVDNILSMSDFRARERALALVIQLSGRSGRKSNGRVIIQTINSEFFKDYLGDFEKFLKHELEFRKDLHYPPFTKLVNVLFSHKDNFTAKEEMLEMVRNLREFKNIEIIGYKEAEISKIAGKFRYNILLRSFSVKDLINAINFSKTKYCEIDIDPVNFS